jgi:hypothetical protein
LAFQGTGRLLESDLEQALLDNLQSFLLELGKGFAFVARQYRITEWMDMYVRMMDAHKCGADDNPTVGIILCTQKDASVVRYSVLQENEQLFASKYKLVLPSEEELRAELERQRSHLAEQIRLGEE